MKLISIKKWLQSTDYKKIAELWLPLFLSISSIVTLYRIKKHYCNKFQISEYSSYNEKCRN